MAFSKAKKKASRPRDTLHDKNPKKIIFSLKTFSLGDSQLYGDIFVLIVDNS
jgi:hypothetical protein